MEELRQVVAVFVVLASLGGTLFWLRRRGLVAFAGKGLTRAGRRMQTVERLQLTAQHSLHLVQVDGRSLLIAVSPGGCSVVDGDGRQNGREKQVAQ